MSHQDKLRTSMNGISQERWDKIFGKKDKELKEKVSKMSMDSIKEVLDKGKDEEVLVIPPETVISSKWLNYIAKDRETITVVELLKLIHKFHYELENQEV